MTAPLVMLHGSFGRGRDWSAVVERSGRPARTPDLPGHGARFEAAAASFDAVVDEIAANLPAGCDLVGYSLGGRLALAAALRAPRGHLRSLVLESAHPGLDAQARARRLREDRTRAAQLQQDPEAFLNRFYRAGLFDSFRADPRFEAVLAERVARARRAPATLSTTFTALSPGNQPELRDALYASGIPTLVVVGARDTKYARLGGDLVRAAPPAASLHLAEIPDAGHNVHFEQPDAFTAALRSFWESLA